MGQKSVPTHNHIYHEIDDCYRVENTGSLRSLSRGSYFTMPDYHLIVKNDPLEIKDLILDVRNEIARFYKDLLHKDCKDLFYEIYRLYEDSARSMILPKAFTTQPIVEELTTEPEATKPYFCIKQQFTYRIDSANNDLQIGTVQVDLANPRAFNLEGSAVIHFSMGSIQRLVDLLVHENFIPMMGLKVKFLKDSYKDVFLATWSKEFGLIVDDKNKNLAESLSIKSLKEQIFYPLVLIVGDKEISTGQYTLVNRLNKKQYTLTRTQLEQYLKTFNFIRNPQVVSLKYLNP